MTDLLSAARHHATCQHRLYALTCGEFDRLYDRAAGACQICRRSEGAIIAAHGQRLYLDHLGGTPNWRVRGLLCVRCNSTLRADSPADDRQRAYLAQAYFRDLMPVLPPEPDDDVAFFRWQRVCVRGDSGWTTTRQRLFNVPMSWAQTCHEYGPPIPTPQSFRR